MKNIVKILDNVRNVNDFDEIDEITLVRGNQTDLYFRLMSRRYNKDGEASDQRYIPQSSPFTVAVQFDNLNQQYHVRRTASQPFPDDASIWKVTILSQDQIMFNSMRVVVTENGKQSAFIVDTDLATEDTGDRRRFT